MLSGVTEREGDEFGGPAPTVRGDPEERLVADVFPCGPHPGQDLEHLLLPQSRRLSQCGAALPLHRSDRKLDEAVARG